MTETPAGPIAGWYQDPEDSRYLRWWNGYQWELRKPVPEPGAPLPGERRPLGRRFAVAERILGVMLVLTMLVLVGQILLYSWGSGAVVDAIEQGDLATASDFDANEVFLNWSLVVCWLTSGISWMVWQHDLAASTQRGELRRGPGMHAGSWAIPVANLWLPCQNVRDLWAVLLPNRRRALVNWWWAAWILTTVTSLSAAGASDTLDSIDDVRDYMDTNMLAAVVALIAGLLAFRVVRRLSREGRRRSGELAARVR